MWRLRSRVFDRQNKAKQKKVEAQTGTEIYSIDVKEFFGKKNDQQAFHNSKRNVKSVPFRLSES